MNAARLLFFLGCCLVTSSAQADWQTVETEQTYAITGLTGAGLYASIGERGPKIGEHGRAIAHTDFKLTWTRKYEPANGACTLVSARPKLVITYVLPKPVEKLSAATSMAWQKFIAGVRSHERVHGEAIKAMVREIEAATVGLFVANDPKCQKIRTVLSTRLAAISRAQRQQSRDFDHAELGEHGNIRRLVYDLVSQR